MDFNPNTWGTVAEWVGGVGTTLAFLATATVIFRDSKVRRESQARKIAYYFRSVDRALEEVQGRYTKFWIHEVKNLSDEPIYRIEHHEVVAHWVRMPTRPRFHEILLPGESFTTKELHYPSKSRREVEFVDNSGRTWIRTLRGGLRERRFFGERARSVWLAATWYFRTRGWLDEALLEQLRQLEQLREQQRREQE